MQKHRPYFALSLLISSLLILRFSGFNLGQNLQSTVVAAPGDVAAWQNAVFVLEGETLTKLNAQLEVVKSVRLPLSPSPTPIPPEPVSELSFRENTSAAQQIPPANTIRLGRICADQQKVYVLYEGVIFTFDHDLNFLLSRAREF